jgi:hypothetical protein
LDGQDRIAAELEEVVLDSKVVNAENPAQICQSFSSSMDRGAARRRPSSHRPRSGFGRAARSILPLLVSGKVAILTKAAGTMCAGS